MKNILVSKLEANTILQMQTVSQKSRVKNLGQDILSSASQRFARLSVQRPTVLHHFCFYIIIILHESFLQVESCRKIAVGKKFPARLLTRHFFRLSISYIISYSHCAGIRREAAATFLNNNALNSTIKLFAKTNESLNWRKGTTENRINETSWVSDHAVVTKNLFQNALF